MDFHDVPLTDIQFLLNYYKQPLSDNLHEQGLNFIINNPYLPGTEDIEDLIPLE